MSRVLCLAACLLCAVPAPAGTVTVDFTPRGDGLIAVPTFLTMFGANRGALTNRTSDGEVFGAVDLRFNAGDAPLSFTAEVIGQATFSAICQEISGGPTTLMSCTSDTGRFGVDFSAVVLDDSDPFGPGLSGFSVDNLVITGEDVSPDDLAWVTPQTPEPSSIALLAITTLALVLRLRRA